MPRITTFLAYDEQAEEAAKFYVSVFKNPRIRSVTRYGEAGPGSKGQRHDGGVRALRPRIRRAQRRVPFQVHGWDILSVDCKTQEEVDTYWEKLSEGGEPGPCGWLKDRFGLYWQINPSILSKMLSDPDPKKSKRVMEAMLKMKKISIEGLKRALRGHTKGDDRRLTSIYAEHPDLAPPGVL